VKQLTENSGKKKYLMDGISILLLCIILFPVFWITVTSLKTEQEIFRIPPTIFPREINTKSYAAQVDSGDFNMFRSFSNSFIISISCMSISVLLAVPAS
jgi:multiple sugar transport system permease protein